MVFSLNFYATMFSGTRQNVHFSSPSGAVVKDSCKRDVIGVTPCVADIPRSSSRTFIFEKEAYKLYATKNKRRF